MPLHITLPSVQRAPHEVTTAALEDALRAAHPDHPRLPVWLRMVRSTTVTSRPWLQPLTSAGADTGVGDRCRTAYAGARDLALTAARDALERAGVAPDGIDCVVTTHTSSWTVPGLDVDLVHQLGLRPDVSRIGLATVACSGGVHALVQAVRYVRAHPHSRVLVVGAEALSTLYHPHQPLTMQSVLYAGLFGDAAGAALVTDSPTDAAALDVVDSWEYVLPDSGDAYWGVIDESGLWFDSGPKATKAAALTGPALAQWLGPVDWAAVHPGGPGIISGTLEAIGLDPDGHGHHSRASLSGGNLGGVAALDVLARTMAAGHARGAGVLVAYGPGFTASALRLR